MINVQGKLPRDIAVAVSGGVDSVAALDFLVNKHNVIIVHMNHSEGNSDASEQFVNALAAKYYLPIFSKRITGNKPSRMSREEWWRFNRYELFHTVDLPIVTAHTLDDCVETWVWSSMHGTGKIIPYANKNVIRPFRMTRKREFVNWATQRNLEWLEDESNEDISLTRNFIRQVMMPSVLTVNPGIYKTISKKVKKDL